MQAGRLPKPCLLVSEAFGEEITTKERKVEAVCARQRLIPTHWAGRLGVGRGGEMVPGHSGQ